MNRTYFKAGTHLARTSAWGLLVLIVLLGVAARAELPPSAYQERQQAAPEFLVIVVQKVWTRQEWGRTLVTLNARVKQVRRTTSKLKPGQLIRIRYTRERRNTPMVGPGPIPILRAGQSCPAFLEFDGLPRGKNGFYAPVAGAYSFANAIASDDKSRVRT